jgi:hypothetical protein
MNIMEMAREANIECWHRTWDNSDINRLEAFAKLVASHEREACAKICDDGYFAFIAADIIRERGEA